MRPLATMLLSLLCSCAAITTPTRFPVRVSSEPPGATVVRDGVEVGRTPCTVVFPRGSGQTVAMRLDGYHEQAVEVGNTPGSLLIALDILLLLPAVVDVATSAQFPVDTPPIEVQLSPLSAPRPRIWRRSDFDPTAPKPPAAGGTIIVAPVRS